MGFGGFSDPNISLIAALFVLGEALLRTGVAQHTGDLLVRHSGASEARLIVLLRSCPVDLNVWWAFSDWLSASVTPPRPGAASG